MIGYLGGLPGISFEGATSMSDMASGRVHLITSRLLNFHWCGGSGFEVLGHWSVGTFDQTGKGTPCVICQAFAAGFCHFAALPTPSLNLC